MPPRPNHWAGAWQRGKSPLISGVAAPCDLRSSGVRSISNRCRRDFDASGSCSGSIPWLSAFDALAVPKLFTTRTGLPTWQAAATAARALPSPSAEPCGEMGPFDSTMAEEPGEACRYWHFRRRSLPLPGVRPSQGGGIDGSGTGGTLARIPDSEGDGMLSRRSIPSRPHGNPGSDATGAPLFRTNLALRLHSIPGTLESPGKDLISSRVQE